MYRDRHTDMYRYIQTYTNTQTHRKTETQKHRQTYTQTHTDTLVEFSLTIWKYGQGFLQLYTLSNLVNLSFVCFSKTDKSEFQIRLNMRSSSIQHYWKLFLCHSKKNLCPLPLRDIIIIFFSLKKAIFWFLDQKNIKLRNWSP